MDQVFSSVRRIGRRYRDAVRAIKFPGDVSALGFDGYPPEFLTERLADFNLLLELIGRVEGHRDTCSIIDADIQEDTEGEGQKLEFCLVAIEPSGGHSQAAGETATTRLCLGIRHYLESGNKEIIFALPEGDSIRLGFSFFVDPEDETVSSQLLINGKEGLVAGDPPRLERHLSAGDLQGFAQGLIKDVREIKSQREVVEVLPDSALVGISHDILPFVRHFNGRLAEQSRRSLLPPYITEDHWQDFLRQCTTIEEWLAEIVESPLSFQRERPTLEIESTKDRDELVFFFGFASKEERDSHLIFRVTCRLKRQEELLNKLRMQAYKFSSGGQEERDAFFDELAAGLESLSMTVLTKDGGTSPRAEGRVARAGINLIPHSSGFSSKGTSIRPVLYAYGGRGREGFFLNSFKLFMGKDLRELALGLMRDSLYCLDVRN